MHVKIGDIIEGNITGIQPYGAFVIFEDGHKGLIHISEISDRFVRDIGNYVHIYDKVKVKVLDIDEEGNHYKLSLKAVQNNKSRFRRKTYSNVQPLPHSMIGFASLQEKLTGWIEDAWKESVHKNESVEYNEE